MNLSFDKGEPAELHVSCIWVWKALDTASSRPRRDSAPGVYEMHDYALCSRVHSHENRTLGLRGLARPSHRAVLWVARCRSYFIVVKATAEASPRPMEIRRVDATQNGNSPRFRVRKWKSCALSLPGLPVMYVSADRNNVYLGEQVAVYGERAFRAGTHHETA